jgi:uncharacterized protein YbjT (DUF2867 family)
MAEDVLISGATGFIGRNLLPRLLDAGLRVRAMSRRPPDKLDFAAHDHLEIVRADLLDSNSLAGVFDGVDVAFYLVHSMDGSVGHEKDFVARDKTAARNFARGAAQAGVDQIVYLSGLKPPGRASAHLESRREVEHIFAAGEVALTVLRAGFIIGDGSAGCVMLDALTETMDTLMVIPDFDNRTQPAYIDDVVAALIACLTLGEQAQAQVFEIGSRETVTYRELIEMYAGFAARQLDIVEVPWAPRGLSSAWISAISGLPYGLIQALSEGLSTDLLISDERLYEICDVPRTSPREAIRQAVAAREGARRLAAPRFAY